MWCTMTSSGRMQCLRSRRRRAAPCPLALRSYPNDRSTPRAASSSPSGPTLIMVETP